MPKQKSYSARVAVEEPPSPKKVRATVPASQPEATVLAAVTEAAGVWHSNQRISGLWGTAESRNTWVQIAGAGWKKLSTNTESSAMALTVLAAHGKLTQTRVDYREEADGSIHELYIW